MPTEPTSSGGSPLLPLGLIAVLVALIGGLGYWYVGRGAAHPAAGAAVVIGGGLPAEPPLDDTSSLFPPDEPGAAPPDEPGAAPPDDAPPA